MSREVARGVSTSVSFLKEVDMARGRLGVMERSGCVLCGVRSWRMMKSSGGGGSKLHVCRMPVGLSTGGICMVGVTCGRASVQRVGVGLGVSVTIYCVQLTRRTCDCVRVSLKVCH